MSAERQLWVCTTDKVHVEKDGSSRRKTLCGLVIQSRWWRVRWFCEIDCDTCRNLS